MNPHFDHSLNETRRHFFGRSAVGIGMAALASLLGARARPAASELKGSQQKIAGWAIR